LPGLGELREPDDARLQQGRLFSSKP